jgi:UDP-glucose 4-epimerase
MGASIVVGGGGFIGSQIVRRLLLDGEKVIVVDNWSRGSHAHVPESMQNNLLIITADMSNISEAINAFDSAKNFSDIHQVWHMAANSDISAGVIDSSIDLKDTFMSTFAVLEAMKKFDIGVLNFASSSAVYGDMGDVAISETSAPLLPISNYGAMKLASEAIISAFYESCLSSVNIFRFPNVVGTPATHGIIFDFINKLIANPNELNVLGNGCQQKSYLHVTDLIDAMFLIARINTSNITLTNIGPIDEGVTVEWIANEVVGLLSPKAVINFGVENRGWVGDVPKFKYSIDLLKSYGWLPKLSSSEAIRLSINEIACQLNAFEKLNCS